METEYVSLLEKEPLLAIKKAGRVIRQGGLVAFPTETVYGLGGNGLNSASSKKIYEAKGRPSDNPLILHISDLSMLPSLVREIPVSARTLAEKFWPGPMTLIFKKADIVPYETTGGLLTVAIRLPAHEMARALIREAKTPIAAPSANLSGRPSPTKASHVKEDLSGRIDMILDGGEVGIGIESTIIDVSGEKPMILRPGFITRAMLEEVVKEVFLDEALLTPLSKEDENIRPKAPGMKYRHYAPKGSLVIYEGERKKVINRINEEVKRAKEEGFITAVLSCEENRDAYHSDVVLSMGSLKDATEAGKRLFSHLRYLDELGAERIFSEDFGREDFFFAIMNRLNKAAGFQRMKVD